MIFRFAFKIPKISSYLPDSSFIEQQRLLLCLVFLMTFPNFFPLFVFSIELRSGVSESLSSLLDLPDRVLDSKKFLGSRICVL